MRASIFSQGSSPLPSLSGRPCSLTGWGGEYRVASAAARIGWLEKWRSPFRRPLAKKHSAMPSFSVSLFFPEERHVARRRRRLRHLRRGRGGEGGGTGWLATWRNCRKGSRLENRQGGREGFEPGRERKTTPTNQSWRTVQGRIETVPRQTVLSIPKTSSFFHAKICAVAPGFLLHLLRTLLPLTPLLPSVRLLVWH